MKQILLLLLAIAPVVAIAQPNYHEGYILKNNGDTLKGFINYREWALSPREIEFKPGSGADVTKFGPGAIKGFQINGLENYISYIGMVSANKNVFPNIPSSLDTTRRADAIFLQQLATGEHVTLYFNNEVNKDRFFIAEKNEAPVELRYYEYYGTSNSDVITDNLYRGQLILLITKYNNADKKLLGELEQVKFEQRDLEDMVDAINNAGLGAKGDIPNNKNKKPLFRLFGGVGINSIASTYNYAELLTGTINGFTEVSQIIKSQSSNALAPKIDFGFDLFVNPNVQQFIFRTELSYSFFSGQFTTPATGSNSTAYSLAYNQHAITLTPQFLFNVYNKDRIKVYLDAGIAISLSAYSDNTSGTNVNGTTAEYGSSWAYIPIQAGVVFNKKIEVSVGYTSFTTSAGYAGVTVSNKSSTNFGIKILFN